MKGGHDFSARYQFDTPSSSRATVVECYAALGELRSRSDIVAPNGIQIGDFTLELIEEDDRSFSAVAVWGLNDGWESMGCRMSRS